MPGTFDFTNIRNKALGLLAKFGRDCVVLRDSDAVPEDANKPWRIAADGTTAEFPFVGPVFYTDIELTKLEGKNTDQSACVVYVPGDLGVEPNTTDRMKVIGTINGQVDPIYAVLKVDRTDPDGNAIMFKCVCTAWPADDMTPGVL